MDIYNTILLIDKYVNEKKLERVGEHCLSAIYIYVVVRSAVTGPDINPGFKVPVHLSTMPQINMIPHPVTLN